MQYHKLSCLGMFVAATLSGYLPHASAAQTSTVSPQRIAEVLAMPHRPTANRARDAEREPAKALPFCRLREDMKVVDYNPGAGWYTEILGPLLKERGELHIAARREALERLASLLAQEPLSRVRKVTLDMTYDSQRGKMTMGRLDFGFSDADLMLSFREYHSFDAEAARLFNQAAYRALKPRGLYCVKDHTRRHMEADSPENRRRVDPVRAILEMQAAGFRLIDSADTFFRADDELRYEVGRRSVSGNTDRFMLLFQKPN